MSKRLIPILLALALALGGCASPAANSEGTVTVYRLARGGGSSGLVREEAAIAEGGNSLESIAAALNAYPSSPELSRAFPEGVDIEQVSLSEGRARVTVSFAYMGLSAAGRLVVNSAIVLSLSALDPVCCVDIVCNRKTVAEGLTVEAIAEADGQCGAYERVLKLYLPDGEEPVLRPRSIKTPDGGGEHTARLMLKELFACIGGGLEDTGLLSMEISGGSCRLDLSQEFYAYEPGSIEEARVTLYSIVNSLCRIPGIDSVRITVEGMDVESCGAYAVVWPLEADMSLIEY